MNTPRRLGMVAAGLGALAAALGAFGAHALRNIVAVESLATWRTAVDYQFWHVLALLAVALLAARDGDAGGPMNQRLRWAGFFFVGGIVLFSGSLYGLVLGAPRWTGAITPIGGVLLIAGWLALLLALRRLR